MNETKSNKVGINDIKELNSEEKMIDHALHLRYRPSGVDAQQTKKNTKRTHQGDSCRCQRVIRATAPEWRD